MTTPAFRIATGHRATTHAAQVILESGGNAADAAIAAVLTACVAEPMLASLGGGGHALIQAADTPPIALDFFAQTPQALHPGPLDFYPILGNFGPDVQEFHVGMASIATPGVIHGLEALHQRFGKLPKTALIEPACHYARQGVPLNTVQHHALEILEPILRATPAAGRWLGLASTDAPLPRVGDLLTNAPLADFMTLWASEGAAAFYQGEVGRLLVAACSATGGHLTSDDLMAYQSQWRTPLTWRYRSATLWSNPPPAFGGMMLALSLLDLNERLSNQHKFRSPEHVSALVQAMASAMDKRTALEKPQLLADETALGATFDRIVANHAPSRRGTTHISIDDGEGMGIALTLSNGEGSGHVIESAGIMMNNMLGEEDINRGGFHQWPPNRRLASMMTPTILVLASGQRILLGSGGSNRIRTALMQVVANLVDFDLDLQAAIDAPRLHLEEDLLSIELASEWPDETRQWLMDQPHQTKPWPSASLFFGGVHAVSGKVACADARREGAAVDGDCVRVP